MIGDALLLGNSATPSAFSHLPASLDNRLIRLSAMVLGSSTERLAAGALIGVFSTPLYLAGIWHIFEASKSGPLYCMGRASICPQVADSAVRLNFPWRKYSLPRYVHPARV